MDYSLLSSSLLLAGAVGLNFALGITDSAESGDEDSQPDDLNGRLDADLSDDLHMLQTDQDSLAWYLSAGNISSADQFGGGADAETDASATQLSSELDDTAAMIDDFIPGLDVLELHYVPHFTPGGAEIPPLISFDQDETADLTFIHIDGDTVASVAGAPELRMSDICLRPLTDLEGAGAQD